MLRTEESVLHLPPRTHTGSTGPPMIVKLTAKEVFGLSTFTELFLLVSLFLFVKSDFAKHFFFIGQRHIRCEPSSIVFCQAHFSVDPVNYSVKNIGCWMDKNLRSIETLEDKHPALMDDYRSRTYPYIKCLKAALDFG